jgi:carboxypeptidase C (cathepsin A)
VSAGTLRTLSEFVGIPPVVLKYWKLDVSTGFGTVFLTSLLQDDGSAVDSYDGRVTAEDTGIAGSVDPNSGGNDPTMTAVGGVYTAMWNVYLNAELHFTSTSPLMDLNDQAFLNWNFGHVDPTGAQKGGIDSLYTAGVAGHLNVRMRHFLQTVALSYENYTASFLKYDTKARMKSTSYAVRLRY